MKIFIQGMRRSGTTILFDIFYTDAQLECYYEPFCGSREAWGSGTRSHIQYNKKVQDLRRKFIDSYTQNIGLPDLNYGAPRQAFLEFVPHLPGYAVDYLHFLFENTTPGCLPLMKFTRMYNKIQHLATMAKDSFLIHIVRDPRCVATSYLLGKNRTTSFTNEDDFFKQKLPLRRWACNSLSQVLLETDRYKHLQECADYMRVLLLWKYTFRQTYNAGIKFFKERYFLLRHEDLCSNTPQTVKELYHFLKLDLPQQVMSWATDNVRHFYPPFAHQHNMWQQGIDRLEMQEELKLAGYNSL